MKNLIQKTFAFGLVISSLFAGSSANAIIHGTVVDSNDPIARSTVALLIVTQEGQGLCTGSIIDESHILTAAHCAFGVSKALIIFKTNANHLQNINPLYVRTVTGKFIDRDYLSGLLGEAFEYNDVAVMSFSGGLPNGYKSVPLLPSTWAAIALQADAKTVIAGYGATDFDATEGSGVLRKLTTKVDKTYSLGKNIKLGTSAHGACHGDSGGPALSLINGQYYLWGVTSRAPEGSAGCSGRAVYTRVR